MLNKLIFISLLITLLLSCHEKRRLGNVVLSEVTDTTYFDSKNWILFGNGRINSKTKNQSGVVDMNLFGFKINTRYLIKDSILYLKDDEKKSVEFLDFRLMGCHSYKTVYGNSIKLLKYYPGSEVGDNYYFFLFKMPYSVVDRPEVKDRFIIYASQKKGIIGISDFYQDSTTIRIHDYRGKHELLIDSSFNTPCL